MPTYGYHCPRCQKDFEVFQRMTDEPGADCPICGSRGRRLFFPAGIVFKGSGFYKTDSRRASDGAASSAGRKAGTRTQPEAGSGVASAAANGSAAGGSATDDAAGGSAVGGSAAGSSSSGSSERGSPTRRGSSSKDASGHGSTGGGADGSRG